MSAKVVLVLLCFCSTAYAQDSAAVQVSVRFGSAPVPGATVVINGVTHITTPDGTVSATVPAGTIEVTAVKDGFAPTTTTVTVRAGQTGDVLNFL